MKDEELYKEKCPYCEQRFILRRSMTSHAQWHKRPVRIVHYTGKPHLGKIISDFAVIPQ